MPNIKVVGLGAGDLNQMPLGVYRVLESAIQQNDTVYLRTKEHPVVAVLEKEGLNYVSFDAFYEASETFEGVYEKIVHELVCLAKEKDDIIYVVPGHPMVAEKVVQTLLVQTEVTVEVLGGHSFVDDLLTAVGVDMIDGFQLVDALDFTVDELILTQHVMIMQVFNDFVASEVKLTLMEKYPPDYRVALVHAAGTTRQQVDWMPLYEIDRLAEGVYNLTTLFLPRMMLDDATKAIQTLQHYMDCIQQKDIWLQEQTHESLLSYLDEEVAEFKEAVAADDVDHVIEELGDVLWQVLFHTSVAERDGYFTFEEVLDVLNRKIRKRHPHVFDGVTVTSVAELDALWQKIKAQEKKDAVR